MAQRIGGVVAAIVPAVLCAYWLFWAYLLMTAEMRQLIPKLEREYERLRRLCWERTTGAALFLAWLDCRAFGAWYRANRPFFLSRSDIDMEDLISAVGRFQDMETSPWVLPRAPIGRPTVFCRSLVRRWKK